MRLPQIPDKSSCPVVLDQWANLTFVQIFHPCSSCSSSLTVYLQAADGDEAEEDNPGGHAADDERPDQVEHGRGALVAGHLLDAGEHPPRGREPSRVQEQDLGKGQEGG